MPLLNIKMPGTSKSKKSLTPAPTQKDICSHTTQTKLCMTQSPKLVHQEHAALLYSRFWTILAEVGQFAKYGRVGFSLTETQKPLKHEDYVIGYAILKFALGSDSVFGFVIPTKAVSVSIATEGFEVGVNAFEFVPTQPSNGTYSYKLISKQVQATFFTKDDVQYLAGITFIMRPLNDKEHENEQKASQKAFEITWMIYRHLGDENATHDLKMYGKYCIRKSQRVLVAFNKDNQKVVHVSFNNGSNTFECEFCSKCDSMKETPSTYFARKMGAQLFYPEQEPIYKRNDEGILESELLRFLSSQIVERQPVARRQSAQSHGASTSSLVSQASTAFLESDSDGATVDRGITSVSVMRVGSTPIAIQGQGSRMPEDGDQASMDAIVEALQSQSDQPRVGSLNDADMLELVNSAARMTISGVRVLNVDMVAARSSTDASTSTDDIPGLHSYFRNGAHTTTSSGSNSPGLLSASTLSCYSRDGAVHGSVGCSLSEIDVDDEQELAFQ